MTEPKVREIRSTLNNKAIDAIAAAQTVAAGFSTSPEVTLDSGVVLRAKTVPRGALRRVQEELPEPEVPTVYVPDHDRDEPNPSDPAYEKALAECYSARMLADQKVRFSLGLELVSVPEGYPEPGDQRWIDELQAAGVTPRLDNDSVRFVEWLVLYVLTSDADVAAVIAKSYLTTTIMEVEVLTALNWFRSRAQRRAAELASAAEAARDGDNVSSAVSGSDTGD